MPILNAQNLDESLLEEFDLIYINQEQLNIVREGKADNFKFKNSDGKIISDKDILERLQTIAVPPTYIDVSYTDIENGHLQAVGIDSKGNKQYFYHVQWEALRSLTKFSALHAFGQKIPAFRRKILDCLNSDDQHDRVLGAMFRILDKTGMRIGGEKSSKNNKTYGITTLRKKHVHSHDGEVDFEYSAKGGVEIELELTDKKLAEVIEECAEIKGQRLFEYKDDNGTKYTFRSHHMNDFLKSHMGTPYSVKDFRTWRFSCLFLQILMSEMNKDEKITLKSLLDKTSEKTGNTPSILQSSYIHPGLISIAKDHEKLRHHLDENFEYNGLRHEEAVFLNYLESEHAKQSLID